jgi:uncharacterized membrane protein HdeD (DUF308 family)
MSDFPDARRLRNAWALFEGGSLLMLGVLAVVLPLITRSVWVEVLGVVLVSAGLVGLIWAIAMHRAPGLRWQLVSALLASVAGALLLVLAGGGIHDTPLRSTLVVLAFVLSHGILSLCYALTHRSFRARGWVWMLISGLGEIAVGALIIKNLMTLESQAITHVLPGIALSWDGLMLILMGRARRPEPMPEVLPSATWVP